MQKLILFLGLIFVLSCAERAKTVEVEKYTIEQFYKNKSIGGGYFNSDGTKLLINSNETGIYNVYALPVDGSAPVALTNSTVESNFAVSFVPHSDHFIFSADKGGDENSRLYYSDGNSVKDLTPFEKSSNSFFGWAKDEQSFFFNSNKRDPRFFDVYEMKIAELAKEKPTATLFYQNNDGMDAALISDNKQYIVLVRALTTSNNRMFLHDKNTGTTTELTPHEGDATYSPQYFSKDNQYLFYITNENNEFTYLVKHNLQTGEKETVMKKDWDIWYAYESENGKYRVAGVNEDARTKVYITETATGNDVRLPDIKDGDITSVAISKDEKLIRLTVGTSTSPSNIYVYNFETGDLRKLTESLNPEIKEDNLVQAKVIRYKSFDGLEIPAIYYEPKEASATHKVPALVWVHGGPGGQSRVGYSSLIQYLVNHGYAVLAVNNRGSDGYGKTFFTMDDQKHGDVDLKDCIEAKKFLASTGVIDENKIGIIGGSYGGYMVMAALCFAPEEFAVGVNIFGVTNWLRTLNSIPPYWESFRNALYKEMGDPYTADSVRLYNISPVFHAKNVTKPLMVLQGANDVRVLKVESDDIVEAVKANGVPVEYIVFDDEGHGFLKKENEIRGYGKIKEFLDVYLKN